jgi:hypothetical protein
MRRERIIQLVALACMLACFVASGVLSTRISASTGRHKLVYSESAEAGDPPQVALGIAMGAFRGLFVNWLWMRAQDMKQEGKYFEAVDLARTITKLQPRFPKVWQFHAWNLAYNISVATQTPQERWNWVQSGIRLLRKEGIPANPSDINLHRELGWIYLHKVQGYMDDAHRFYKRWHALEWSRVMGRPPTVTFDAQTDGRSTRELYIERWLRPIVEAPSTLEELYAIEPAGKALVEALKQLDIPLGVQLLERFEVIAAFAQAAATTQVPVNVEADPLFHLMLDDRLQNAGRLLIAHVRKRTLIDVYNMEPDRMLRYTERFGPLDWRHPAAHSVYWSTRGSDEALRRVSDENKRDFDFVNNDRVTIQAVQELFRTGLITFDIINPDFYLALPNTDYTDTYHDILAGLVERSWVDDAKQAGRRPFSVYWAGYENFMRDAIRYLYRRGDVAAASAYKDKLAKHPNLNQNNPGLVTELTAPIEEFVTNEILKDDRISSPQVALQEIAGALQAAYVNGLLRSDDKVFRNEFGYAQLFHAKYQETQQFRTWVAGEAGRMGFPEFDVTASQLLAGVIQAANVPAGPTMYRRAPLELRGRARAILETMPIRRTLDEAEKINAGLGFDIWFPEPPGMERYRQEVNRDRRPDKGTIDLK